MSDGTNGTTVQGQVSAPQSTPKTSKSTRKTDGKSNGLDKMLAKARDEAKKKPSLSPWQSFNKWAKDLSTEKLKPMKEVFDELLSGLSDISKGRIRIGRALLQAQNILGEGFGTFIKEEVFPELRIGLSTAYEYMGIASAATIKFDKNDKIRQSLFRIWGAEGCYDKKTGRLNDKVDMAIRAMGGIPANGKLDMQGAEQWARDFVKVVDNLVRKGRSARTQGDVEWTKEQRMRKYDGIVRDFTTYVKKARRNDTITLWAALTVVLRNAKMSDPEFFKASGLRAANMVREQEAAVRAKEQAEAAAA